MTGGPESSKPLDVLRMKLQLLRDDVRGVALGYHGGMLVFGRGGLSKSFTIGDELRRLGATARRSTARMSARGLFEHLRANPGEVSWIEDNEALLRDPHAVSVLRSALWAAPTGGREDGDRVPDRLVTWFAGRDRDEFVYTGGVILVGNSPPPRTPEVEALLSRVPVTHLQISDAEMTAYMRHLAATAPPIVMGYRLAAEEAGEVCEFVIEEAQTRGRPLDVRLLYTAYRSFVQFEIGDSGCHWADRVRAMIAQHAPRFDHPVDLSGTTRLERERQEIELVREIVAGTPVRTEQVRVWVERTGKCPRTFDSRKARLKAEGGVG